MNIGKKLFLVTLNTEIKEEKLAYEKRIKLRNEYWKKIIHNAYFIDIDGCL